MARSYHHMISPRGWQVETVMYSHGRQRWSSAQEFHWLHSTMCSTEDWQGQTRAETSVELWKLLVLTFASHRALWSTVYLPPNPTFAPFFPGRPCPRRVPSTEGRTMFSEGHYQGLLTQAIPHLGTCALFPQVINGFLHKVWMPGPIL